MPAKARDTIWRTATQPATARREAMKSGRQRQLIPVISGPKRALSHVGRMSRRGAPRIRLNDARQSNRRGRPWVPPTRRAARRAGRQRRRRGVGAASDDRGGAPYLRCRARAGPLRRRAGVGWYADAAPRLESAVQQAGGASAVSRIPGRQTAAQLSHLRHRGIVGRGRAVRDRGTPSRRGWRSGWRRRFLRSVGRWSTPPSQEPRAAACWRWCATLPRTSPISW